MDVVHTELMFILSGPACTKGVALNSQDQDQHRPQRVTLPTLQIVAAFMSDLSRDDRHRRTLSVHTGLGSGTVLQCLYQLENLGWLESRWEDRDVATRDGRPPRAVLPA